MKKYFIFFLLFLLPFAGKSQSKINVIFQIVDAKTKKCLSNDLNKEITFQYKYDSLFKDIKTFTTNKCFNSYTISKKTGRFKILISVSGYQTQEIIFDVKEKTLGPLYLGKVYVNLPNNQQMLKKNKFNKNQGIVVSGKKEYLKPKEIPKQNQDKIGDKDSTVGIQYTKSIGEDSISTLPSLKSSTLKPTPFNNNDDNIYLYDKDKLLSSNPNTKWNVDNHSNKYKPLSSFPILNKNETSNVYTPIDNSIKNHESEEKPLESNIHINNKSSLNLIFKIVDSKTNACLADDLNKEIKFQYKYDSLYKDVKTFNTAKCYNSYTISKIPGKFRILVSAIGHQTQSIDFDVVESLPDTLLIGNVYMNNIGNIGEVPDTLSNSEITNMEGVVVVGGKKEMIKVEANKTTYSVKDNELLSGGNAEEALTKIPGVIKGYGGELTVNGKSMAIYIDNSPTGLSGSDLEGLLQGMPASSIEKIEIISNPGASYEANTGGGIINIVTNGRASLGLNGTATVNYRFNKQNIVSPSISLNTRKGSVGLQLNSGFSYRENETLTSYNREFTSFSPSVLMNQNNNNSSYNRFYYFRPSANIRLNDRSNILINYNFNYSHDNNSNLGVLSGMDNSGNLNLINNFNSKNDNTNHEIIAKYRTEIDSLGKVFDITAYYSNFNKNLQNRGIQNNLGIYDYSINEIDSKSDNFYLKSNIEIPIHELDLTINAGGKFSLNSSSSKGKYNLLNSSPLIFDNPNYNTFMDFKYDENQYALYTELSKNFNKLSITAGLRYENLEYTSKIKESLQKSKHSLEKFYPSFSLLYRLNSTINFNASYRKSISLPSYTSLDPNITGYYDEYNTTTGNLFLEPNYYDNYEASISAFNYLRLGFQYTHSKSINLMSYENAPNSLVVNQTTKTYNGVNSYNISLGVPVPFGLITKGKKFFDEPMNVNKMSFFYFYTMYNYYKIDDYPYMDKVKPMWFYALYTQIVLPKEIKLTGFYLFSSKDGYFQIYKSQQPINYSNIELSRSFYNKNLKVSLGMNNVFSPTKLKAQISNPNLLTNFYQRNQNQLYYIKLSYNFGKLKNMKKENTVIESDKAKESNQLIPTPLNP
ncbi:TonB-dependent receptor [Apibacter muscae]|uniref:TonB-dependent receptor n=1 Tax=Apibacter muscae TaxID=2509004 RepID=A0A563DHF9_9FLAO|nr:TonB-dependent receptor [Apibacter muscae]TWP29716.1 TonB-dependent receptor [Apibacter muscae]